MGIFSSLQCMTYLRVYPLKSPGICRFHFGDRFVCRNSMLPLRSCCTIVFPVNSSQQKTRSGLHGINLYVSSEATRAEARQSKEGDRLTYNSFASDLDSRRSREP